MLQRLSNNNNLILGGRYFENKQFNFMDFACDKTEAKYIYENPIKEFRNVLLGKSFLSIEALKKGVPFLPKLRYPRSFIYCPDDICRCTPA